MPVIREQQELVTQFFQTSSEISTPEKLADVIADESIARYRDLPEQLRKDWIASQIFMLCYILHYQQPNALDVKVDAAFADQMIMDDGDISALKQVEMQEAFRRGVAKEYSEFYGITAQSLVQFLKGFRASAKRQKALIILYDKEQKRLEEEKRNENRLLYELRKRDFVNPWDKKEKPTAMDSEEHRKKIARQREEIMRQNSKNPNIDRMFIGAVRSNTGIIRFMIGEGENTRSYSIPYPDKQLGFELSNAIRSYMIRRDKQLKNK